MSEQITHLAVADDARLLALHSPRVAGGIRDALAGHHDKMRLGAVIRNSERFAGPVIRTLRDRVANPGPRDGEKLAFCLGTLAHRAADRMMKPIFSSQTADGKYTRKDISISHDVFLFRRIYNAGGQAPYTPEALDPVLQPPAGANVDMATLEALFRILFQRTLLAAHTFIPDTDDAEGWLDRLFDRLQEMTIDIGHYHRILTQSDPELYRRAIEQVNFFNDKDPIVALAAELRAGETVSPEQFLRRTHLGDRNSLYARMLSASYGYIQTASEFWHGRASEELFFDAITR